MFGCADNTDNAHFRSVIRDEIKAQMIVLKSQIIKEITADMRDMIEVILSDSIGQAVNAAKNDISATVTEKIDNINNQIVVSNTQAHEIANEKTRELVLAVGQQVCNTVFEQVIGEINEKIVPGVSNMVQWVNYTMQDGGEVVDNYRRAVEHQTVGLDPRLKLITNGKQDSRIISPNVRTFFSDDSSDDD